jgi:hypothetical protein
VKLYPKIPSLVEGRNSGAVKALFSMNDIARISKKPSKIRIKKDKPGVFNSQVPSQDIVSKEAFKN